MKTAADMLRIVAEHQSAVARIIPDATFAVQTVHEIADGLIIVRESEGLFLAYFDTDTYMIARESVRADEASEIHNFPSGAGIFTFERNDAKTMPKVIRILGQSLVLRQGGRTIRLFGEPRELVFNAGAV